MEYRRPLPEDFSQILDLQNKNLFSALTSSDRKDGFLSTAYTKDQFLEMDRTLGAVVGVEAGKVCGYIFAGTEKFYRNFIRASALLDQCAKISYRGKPLTSYRFFIANPICIDKDYRGADVYVRLCDKLLETVPKDYDLVLGFISIENTRHLSAVKKVKMEVVGEFQSGEEKFCILARVRNL